MPYHNVWETHGLYRVFSGELQGDEIFSSNVAVQADPRFPGIRYIINDFTGISGHQIDDTHIWIYAKTDHMVAGSKQQLKIALLVQGAEQMALAQDYKSLMSDCSFDCDVFTELADARAWAEADGPAQAH